MFKKYINLNKLSTLLFYISILLFIIAFNFAHNPPGGWYQQFMPNLNGASITDITFTDSLTGFGVTLSPAYVIKTTNGGDNWIINYNYSDAFYRIQFVNKDTGYILSINKLLRTFDQGNNWTIVNLPPDLYPSDIFALNVDTIWAADDGVSVGGIFKTTNGGQNWERQFGGFSGNPDKVYFYDANLGFINNGVGNNILRRTTNGGMTWTEIQGVGGFTDIEFIDENTGWKALTETERIRKTTNGGINWIDIWLPPAGNIILDSRIKNLSIINQDTIWGDYPLALYNKHLRGILYLSTDRGSSWGFQVPEDSIQSNVPAYEHLQFLNKNTGWAYQFNRGVHTKTGGDTTIILDIKQLNNTIPADFNLYQNYPNPFNPVTKIRFDIAKTSNVMLIINDILGKEVATLVNHKQNAGSYEVEFNGSNLSSGVYLYSLITEKVTITKKMLLTK